MQETKGPEKGTVLLLGGRSFAGGHVCRALLARGYSVIIQSSHSAAFQNLADVLPHPMVETVHCANDDMPALGALMHRAQRLVFSTPPPSQQTLGKSAEKERDFENLRKMLDCLSASSIEKSVFISTCSRIAKQASGLANEEMVAPADQGWQVLAFKSRYENLVQDYARKGFDIVIANPTMFVGKYDTRPSTGEFFRFVDGFPLMALKGTRINIVDTADVGRGVVLALEKGRSGERYILGGENILLEDLIARIKKCGGRKTPRIELPYALIYCASLLSEFVNMLLRRNKPLIPLLGLELPLYGNQHYSLEKARVELGYVPGDTWAAVDESYRWYKDHGIL